MNNSVGTYALRKITKQIDKLYSRLEEIKRLATIPPSITIYNIQELINESSNDWPTLVTAYLVTLNINQNWIYDIINPTNSTNPERIVIQFPAHCIREKIFTVISTHLRDINSNALVMMDD
jgi:HJR/Mrr/RecB family endonuclease